MKNKFLKSLDNINNNNILHCPLCKSDLYVRGHELICLNNHAYTISKKGDVFLTLPSSYKTSPIYNKELFLNRRKFINKDYYTDVYSTIASVVNVNFKKSITVLDLGSGEGTHMQKILNKVNTDWKLVSIDYSKDAVSLATDYIENNICIVGDINNLPLKDASIDIIVDFLSPYNAAEVKRVLKDDGIIIKVVPGNKYLHELREKIELEEYRKKEDVKNNFLKYFEIIEEKESIKTYAISLDDCENLIMMSPLKREYKSKDLIISSITIDNIIYVGRCRNEKE